MKETSVLKTTVNVYVDISKVNDNLFYVTVRSKDVESKMPAHSYEAACAVADSSVAGIASFILSQSL